MSPGVVLHLLSQRPSLTGSGVTLDALVSAAADAGWEQHVVVGVPAGETGIRVGGLRPQRVYALAFGDPPVAYPVPGMSDVMPYPSTVFSRMTKAEWDGYVDAWRRHLRRVSRQVHPDVVHTHHCWVLSSLVKDAFPGIPVLTHCHSTGLRQLSACPQRAPRIIKRLLRNDAFAVLDSTQRRALIDAVGVDTARVHEVGAGYRDDLFHARGRLDGAGQLLFVGKISAAKGLPWLLDAVQQLARTDPQLRLHVAGSGSGPQAEALQARMREMPAVVQHGGLTQVALARLMRHCSVCVLPSMYEGLPLVLVEAQASGCRLVATALPAVRERLAPVFGEALRQVLLPRLRSLDDPEPAELPAFVEALRDAIAAALRAGAAAPSPQLSELTWRAVFQRVEKVWSNVISAETTGSG